MKNFKKLNTIFFKNDLYCDILESLQVKKTPFPPVHKNLKHKIHATVYLARVYLLFLYFLYFACQTPENSKIYSYIRYYQIYTDENFIGSNSVLSTQDHD